MKKILILAILISFIFSIYANNVGLVTYYKGKPKIIRNNVESKIKKNSQIELSDIIKTDKKSKVRIIFFTENLNGTRIIGRNKKVSIESIVNKNKSNVSLKHISTGILNKFLENQNREIAAASFDEVAVSKESIAEIAAVRSSRAAVAVSKKKVAASSLFISSQKIEKLLVYPKNKLFFTPKKIILKELRNRDYNYEIIIENLSTRLKEKILTKKKVNKLKKRIFNGRDSYKIVVNIISKGKKIHSEQSVISFLNKQNKYRILKELKKIKEVINDKKDYSIHLLYGSYLYENGLYSDSLIKYLSYLKYSGKSEFLKFIINQNLEKMGSDRKFKDLF